jgi:hypothetical protein
VAVHYMQDEKTPTGQCVVLVKDTERSLVANLGAANNYKVCVYVCVCVSVSLPTWVPRTTTRCVCVYVCVCVSVSSPTWVPRTTTRCVCVCVCEYDQPHYPPHCSTRTDRAPRDRRDAVDRKGHSCLLRCVNIYDVVCLSMCVTVGV